MKNLKNLKNLEKRAAALLVAVAMLASMFGTAETTEKLFYTITFDTNGMDTPSWQGTVGEDTSFMLGDFPIPEKQGYHFWGWITEQYSGMSAERMVFNRDTTLYANYSRIPLEEFPPVPLYAPVEGAPFAITFDTLRGDSEHYFTILTREDGTLLSEDLALLAGWGSSYMNFGQWIDADSKEVLPTTAEQLGTVFTKDTTIHAVWKPAEKVDFVVILDPNGGKVTPSRVVLQCDESGSGAKIGSLPTPEKFGHIFEGWFTERNGGARVTNDMVFCHWGMLYGIPQSIYAQWSIDFSTPTDYTVTTVSELSLDLTLVTGFIDGLAMAAKYQECGIIRELGLINRYGKIVLPMMFDAIKAVSEGFAAVRIGDKWGYVDMSGNVVIEPIFDDVRGFKNGFAAVRIGSPGVTGGWDNIELSESWGFINAKGELVVPVEYTDVGNFGDNGLALVAKGTSVEWMPTGFRRGVGAKWGYINTRGEVVIPLMYDRAGDFSEGLAAVALNDEDGRRFWGYINAAGEVVIELQYGGAGQFQNGLAVVTNPMPDGGSGFVNKDGKVIIPLRYSMIDSFFDGFVTVRNWVLANPMGQEYSTYSATGELISREIRSGPSQDRHRLGNGLVMSNYGLVDERGAVIIPSAGGHVMFIETVGSTSYFWRSGAQLELIAVTNNKTAAADFQPGYVLGKDYICVLDALEILKYIVGIETVIADGNRAFNAARITGGDTPTVSDALEILKYLVQLPSRLERVR